MKLSSARLRALVSDCKTEIDIVRTLRAHKVKYTFTTETGYMTIRIPCKKGTVRIVRTCSRSWPFVVRSDCSVPVYPVPVLHNDY